MKNKKNMTVFLTRSAVIAALYAAMTIVLSPISFGAWQVRISEAMTLLPLYFPEAIPGLFIGCLIANLINMNVFDIIFGSLATLCAACLTYFCRKTGKYARFIAPLPPIIINAVAVGLVLSLSMTNDTSFAATFALNSLTVALGQTVACYGFGVPLSYIFERLKGRMKK